MFQAVVCIECRAVCEKNFVTHNCNFSKARHRLPEDGPNGPKHVGANMRYFNCTF